MHTPTSSGAWPAAASSRSRRRATGEVPARRKRRDLVVLRALHRGVVAHRAVRRAPAALAVRLEPPQRTDLRLPGARTVAVLPGPADGLRRPRRHPRAVQRTHRTSPSFNGLRAGTSTPPSPEVTAAPSVPRISAAARIECPRWLATPKPRPELPPSSQPPTICRTPDACFGLDTDDGIGQRAFREFPCWDVYRRNFA